MSKCDKRENIIMIASEPLTFEQGRQPGEFRSDDSITLIDCDSSRLDGDPNEHAHRCHSQGKRFRSNVPRCSLHNHGCIDEPSADPNQR